MLTRRSALLTGAWAMLAAAAPARGQDFFGEMRGSLDASEEGVRPDSSDDQSDALSRALAKAEAEGQPLFLPPGRYEIREIMLPPHADLIGVPGRTHLAFRSGRFMLRAENAARLRLQGLVVDGRGFPLDA